MRYAILADVHANLPALEAVMESARRAGVEQMVVAGDLVGYGPHPNECVNRLLDENAVCVAGNHDLYASGRLIPGRLPAFVRASVEWTDSQIHADVRARLTALPTAAMVGDILVAHGSLDDPEEYVTTPGAAERHRSKAQRVSPHVRTLVLGHTHRQMFFTYDRRCGAFRRAKLVAETDVARPSGVHLLNPGSVGQSRQREPEPLARFAMLDTAAATLVFRAVRYDTEATRSALRRAGLDETLLHLPPPPFRLGRVRHLAATAGKRLSAPRRPT